jgi:hypothetical protein
MLLSLGYVTPMDNQMIIYKKVHMTEKAIEGGWKEGLFNDLYQLDWKSEKYVVKNIDKRTTNPIRRREPNILYFIILFYESYLFIY